MVPDSLSFCNIDTSIQDMIYFSLCLNFGDLLMFSSTKGCQRIRAYKLDNFDFLPGHDNNLGGAGHPVQFMLTG